MSSFAIYTIASLPRAVQQPINNPPIDEQGRNSRGAWLSRGELVRITLGLLREEQGERQWGQKIGGKVIRQEEKRGSSKGEGMGSLDVELCPGWTNTSWGITVGGERGGTRNRRTEVQPKEGWI